MDISKVDKNFVIESKLNIEGICFYNIEDEPFSVYGVFKENGKYRRMPEASARSISTGVYALHACASGGRVRFVTDSPYVAAIVKLDGISRLSHLSLLGSAGLDLYVREDGREVYRGSFKPPYDTKDEYEGCIEFGDELVKMREITINFPPYSVVTDIYIGLDKDSTLSKASPYINKYPIVYYGHSITQGGCVSRPGYVYSNIISRRFHYNFINLGFSGSAKGEDGIAQYIASLKMQLFVYDYDHNAPDADHLRATHENMFKIIRKTNPDLPIVILTATPYLREKDALGRKQAIYNTYKNAIDSGDKNVYFIDCSKIFDDFADGIYGATVEGCHLNDVGFVRVAEVLGDLIDVIL